MKNYFFGILFLLCSGSLFAQFTVKVKGLISDRNTSEPVPCANVLLLNPADSAFIHGSVADSLGQFEIEGKAKEQFIIKASSIGCI